MVARFLLGAGMLIAGAEALVRGATRLAAAAGVSRLVIGLTVVAIGTGSPEMAVAVRAALAGEADITVGNVIGSNLFNILAVLGIAALLSPGGLVVPLEAVRLDMPIMIATAVAILPIFAIGGRIERWEGAFFLGYYVTFVAYLYLRGTESLALAAYSRAVATFVIPLTAVTLLALLAAQVQARQRGADPGDRRPR